MASSIEDHLEMKGRLWLWADAVNECSRLLKLATKAEVSMHSDAVKARLHQSNEAFQNWVKLQPDYEPGRMLQSHLVEFDKMEQQDFGTFVDCANAKDYFRMLAVVFFCQILNNGGRSEGTAAGNTKAFRNIHFEKILCKIFKTVSERSQFEILREQLLTARDKMLGHADGSAFSIVHGEAVSSLKMYHTAIEAVDFAHFASFLEPMTFAIYEYARSQNT